MRQRCARDTSEMRRGVTWKDAWEWRRWDEDDFGKKRVTCTSIAWLWLYMEERVCWGKTGGKAGCWGKSSSPLLGTADSSTGPLLGTAGATSTGPLRGTAGDTSTGPLLGTADTSPPLLLGTGLLRRERMMHCRSEGRDKLLEQGETTKPLRKRHDGCSCCPRIHKK